MLKSLLPIFFSLLFSVTQYSAASESRGRDIAIAVDTYNRGYGDFEVRMQMQLFDRKGKLRVSRKVLQRVLEVEVGDITRKSIVVFEEPPADRGVGLLSVIRKVNDNEQFLYLPSIRRTKRIVSRSRAGAFAGSELSYEDLDPDDVLQFEYVYLGTREYAGQACELIERVPKNKNSGYAKQHVCYSMSAFQPLRIESFDRKDELLKVHEYAGYRVFLDKYYRPTTLSVTNVQTKKRTTLVFDEYSHRVGFQDSNFRKEQLENFVYD